MKVILTDNYDRELFDDKLIKANLSEEAAKALADDLNDRKRIESAWYKAVADDYELFERDY